MKPTKTQIVKAVEDFGMLKYFPSDDAARKAVMRLLAAMVATQADLAWLVSVMVNQVGEWQGPVELRGVLCSRYRPADGIEAVCAGTGAAGVFSPLALEARSELLHAETKLLGAGESAALLPAAKTIPPPDDGKWEVLAKRPPVKPPRPRTECEVNRLLEELGV